MKKIAVASGKGGVGKSMVASSLAMLFVREQKIVVVDADVDAPNLHLWLGQNENWDKTEKISTTQKPVVDQEKCDLCGKCVDICAFNALAINNRQLEINRFFCEGCGACEAVCPQKAIRLETVANAQIQVMEDVGGFPLVSAQLSPGETGSGKIVDELTRQASEFTAELMILDVAAGAGCPVIAALKESDFVVLVAEPSLSSLSDLKRVLLVIDHFQLPFGLVINKWGLNKKIGRKLEKNYENKLLGKIAFDKKIFKAIASLTPVLNTDLVAKQELKQIFTSLKKVIKPREL